MEEEVGELLSSFSFLVGRRDGVLSFLDSAIVVAVMFTAVVTHQHFIRSTHLYFLTRLIGLVLAEVRRCGYYLLWMWRVCDTFLSYHCF